MSYLPSDRWFLSDPPEESRAYWVTVQHLPSGTRFVEKLTWFGAVGRWGSPFDTDTLHFKILAYMRLDVPNPYFL